MGNWTSLVAQMVKNLPAMQETWVQSLGWEDPLEKVMATHSSTLAPGESHGGRSLVGYSPWGRKESDTAERLHLGPVYQSFCSISCFSVTPGSLTKVSLFPPWHLVYFGLGVLFFPPILFSHFFRFNFYFYRFFFSLSFSF